MADKPDDATPNSDSDGLFQDVWGPAAPLMAVPPTESPQLYPGLELWGGRFQIVRRIGAGGMGVVHEAYDRERGENVALKTLSRMDAASIYRMKNEFRALAEVIHPNLVRLHELFADSRLWLFTMELIRGEPFLQWVRPQGVLDVRRLRHGLAQIVAGVRTIHDAGKLHRDLKPSNVLVTNSDRIVILDFGLIADPELGGPGQTMADDRVSGTPSYISPEQAAGDAPTTASDWYGVGVLLFEALTGHMPFPDRGYVVMQRKQAIEPPRAKSLAPDIPDDLDALCAALLSRAPEARPTGEELSVIAAVQRHTPAPSAAPSISTPPSAQTPSASLVGREAEFDALREAFATAASGQAVVARVTGESGVGKSALIRAFLDELRAQGRAVVLSGRCYERESVPYKAIDRVVDALTRFLRQLPDLEMATLMPRDVGALARIFPVLERIELVAAAAPARAASNDQELRRRAFEAFADLLAGIRDRHMLVLHVDDMQWIDHDSVLLLEHLLGQPDPPPLLLITGHRGAPQDNPLLARIDQAVRANRAVGLREISVGPLSPIAATELAERLLQSAHGDPTLAVAVAAEAQGNPFFIVELARYAAQPGARGERHAVSLGDAIRKRAADLGPAARRLLELLAISARPTPGDVLVRAISAGDDAHHALDLLRGAQLVREGGGRTYECYHDRIRGALTEHLSREVTRDYHLRLATAWTERANTDPELLFEHWRAAGQDARAAACAVEAGQRAGSNLAFERSAAFFGHAASLLPDAEAQRLDLHEKRAEALSLAGRWAEAAQAFAKSEALATDPARRAHLLHRSAVHFLGSGQSAEGLPRLHRLFVLNGIAWPKSRVGAVIVAFFRLVWLRLRGAPRPVLPRAPSAEEAVALECLLESAGLVPPYDIARGVYFMTAFAIRGLRSTESAHVAVACGILATLFSGSRFSRALSRRMADEASTLARSCGRPDLASVALSFVGYTRLIDERVTEALSLGIEAESLVGDSPRTYLYQTWGARTIQSSALLVLGRIGEMAALCERNGRLARELGNEMAMIGGDSPLRFLMTDDIERAKALIEHKQEVIARAKDHGALHQIVRVEHVLYALYAGRGADVMDLAMDGSEGLSRFFDPSMLAACAALQASPSGDRPTRRLLRRTIRGLQRGDEIPANEAMVFQLQAVLCLLERDVEGALLKMNAAAERYAAAGMALHEALMLWRFGRLRGGADGERSVEHARRFMSAQGIVRPEGWARMLAPGLE